MRSVLDNLHLVYRLDNIGKSLLVRGGTRTRMPEDPAFAAKGVYQFHHAHRMPQMRDTTLALRTHVSAKVGS